MAPLAQGLMTDKAPRQPMSATAQSVEATQEIHLEDIVEMREAARVSSVELDDDDILEEEPAEDLAATRIQISRVTSASPTTAVMATLRVPSLTLAQAMSALARETTRKTSAPRPRFGSQLPAPIWASIGAAVAALVVGSAALAATHGDDESDAIAVRVAERDEPQSASKAMRRKYITSEQLGRWSEVPTYVADVSVASVASVASPTQR